MHKWVHFHDETAYHQAHSCGLLKHPNRFCGMFKPNGKCDADLLFYLLSHSECKGHTVHMLTQWCLLLPLIGTV